MSTQNFPHNTPGIEIELSKLKPYLIVILKKSINYHKPDSQNIIQTEHLPYIFNLKSKGIMAIPMPVRDETDIAAIGVFVSNNKEEAGKIMDNDPAVIKGIFTYLLLNAIGLQGDSLL